MANGFADRLNQTLGGGGDGSDFPTAPAILVPRPYVANSDQNVPGLGGDGTYQYQQGGSATAAEHAQQADTPVSLRQSLQYLLTLGATDVNGTLGLQESMIKAGYLNPSDRRGSFTPGHVASGDSTYEAYARLANDAIVTGKSIYDLLDQRANDPGNKQGQRNFRLYQQQTGQVATTKTYTSRNVNLSTTGDAFNVAQNEYQKLLGRDPSKHEINALHAALNAYEQAHPTVSTHTVVSDPTAGISDRGGTTSGGVTAGDQQMLTDSRISQTAGKELGQVQTDRLVQVFEQMLGGGSGG